MVLLRVFLLCRRPTMLLGLTWSSREGCEMYQAWMAYWTRKSFINRAHSTRNFRRDTKEGRKWIVLCVIFFPICSRFSFELVKLNFNFELTRKRKIKIAVSRSRFYLRVRNSKRKITVILFLSTRKRGNWFPFLRLYSISVLALFVEYFLPPLFSTIVPNETRILKKLRKKIALFQINSQRTRSMRVNLFIYSKQSSALEENFFSQFQRNGTKGFDLEHERPEKHRAIFFGVVKRVHQMSVKTWCWRHSMHLNVENYEKKKNLKKTLEEGEHNSVRSENCRNGSLSR